MPFIKKRKKQPPEHVYSAGEVKGTSMWSELEKKLKKLLGLC